MRIKELSTSLIEHPNDFENTMKVLNEVQGIYEEINNVSGKENDYRKMAAIPTASGMALGMVHAAQCLSDYNRTEKLFTGLVNAIRDKQKEKPGETIHVFYAGCGPYALMFSLVAPLFTPEEVQFSLLEINSDAMMAARKLVKKLDLNDYIKANYMDDAVVFNIPEPESVDVLFSETLDVMLFREGYLPILWNLLPQLREDVAVIPENVSLSWSYILPSLPMDPNGIIDVPETKQALFDVRKTLSGLSRGALPEEVGAMEVDLEMEDNYDGIVIDTKVHVYGGVELERGESSLTSPVKIKFPANHNFKKAYFKYQLSPQIEFKFDFN